MTDEKRKYVRLTPSQWAEIEAVWRTGEATLAQLSDTYGVSTRALQLHFEKECVSKGSAAREIAGVIEARVFKERLADPDLLVERAADIRETAYQGAVALERLLIARLEEAARDPKATFSAAAAIKMCSLAAQALERTHSLKRAALGLGDNDHADRELPVLEIVDLSPEDIEQMRREQEEEHPLAKQIERA